MIAATNKSPPAAPPRKPARARNEGFRPRVTRPPNCWASIRSLPTPIMTNPPIVSTVRTADGTAFCPGKNICPVTVLPTHTSASNKNQPNDASWIGSDLRSIARKYYLPRARAPLQILITPLAHLITRSSTAIERPDSVWEMWVRCHRARQFRRAVEFGLSVKRETASAFKPRTIRQLMDSHLASGPSYPF